MSEDFDVSEAIDTMQEARKRRQKEIDAFIEAFGGEK